MKRGRSNDQYDVEEILEMKYVNGAPYYKVKWLDYPIKDATWEPKENLMSVDWMIDKFENKLIESRSKTYGENSIVSKKVLAKSIAKEKKKSIAAYSYEEYGLMAPKSFSKPNREKIMHINFPEKKKCTNVAKFLSQLFNDLVKQRIQLHSVKNIH